MKKIILFLILLCCSFLYAQTKVFKTDYGYTMSDIKRKSTNYYPIWIITAILPYENGYVMKLSESHEDRKIEYFITKGFSFYFSEKDINYRCTITDIKPNEFTAEMEVVD